MNATRTIAGVCVAAVVGWASPLRGDPWFRDFEDGTLQGLSEFDIAWIELRDSFNPAVVDGAARLRFTTGDGHTDTAVLYDSDDVFTDTSVKMLIKWSTNPLLVPDGTRVLYIGMFMRATIDLIFYQFQAYVVLMTDEGDVGMVKLTGLDTPDICPEGQTVIPNFDPSKNWWLRGETLDVQDGVLIRVRAWPEGTPEPEEWHAQCTDTAGELPVYLSGQVGLGAQEDDAAEQSQDQAYVDVDHVSAGPVPEYVCYNRLDDDGDGLTDCDDPDCAAATACACSDPFADMDRDGDVDQVDFGMWQVCYTRPAPTAPLSPECDCLDREDANGDGFFNPPVDGDGDVDLDDFLKFQLCASGPAVPASKDCD